MSERASNTTVQYTRLTHADRLPDRFITSQVYTPADPESQREGMMFSQIEILNPWFPTSQIGQTIINTIIREYYRATDTSELNNFETALKKVNEMLAQITQSGETDWVGNLHGILLLINGTDIHISQTGQTQAYLFRGGKINHITEGLMDNAEIHPLRTFSNITSGTLQAGDKIIIANPLFFKTVDMDLIRDVIVANPPALAAREFANILKRHRALAGEALVIEIATKNEAAELPLEYKTDTIYLDHGGVGSVWQGLQGAVSGINFSGASPGFKKFHSKITDGLKRADRKFDEHVTPRVQSIAKKTFHIAKSGTDKVWRKFNRGRVGEPTRAPAIVAKTKEKLVPLGRKIADKFSFDDDQSPRARSRRYAIWGAALLIVLVVLILASRIPGRNTIATNDSQMQGTISELGDKFNKVKLLSAYNDKQTALGELAGIFTKLAEIESKQELPPSLAEIKKQAIDELGTLTNTHNLNGVEKKADWGDRNLITPLGDDAYAINDNLITKVSNKEDAQLGLGHISAITTNDDKKFIYLLSDQGVSSFSAGNKKISKVKLGAGSWPASQSIAFFNDNLYMLDPAQARIVKFTPQENGFSEGADYGKPEGSELKNAVSLAINGRVIALLKDSTYVEYTSSGRTAGTFSGLPSDGFIKNPKFIYADPDSVDVVVFHEDKWVNDLWHLTKFNRSGKYIESFFLPDTFKNWKAIDYLVKDKVLWAVTDSKVYTAKTGE